MLASRLLNTPLPLSPQLSAPPVSCPARSLSRAAKPSRRHRCAAEKSDDGKAAPSSSGASPEAEAAFAAVASTSGSDAQGSSAADKGVAEMAKNLLMGDSEIAAQVQRYEDALAQLEANKAGAAELEKRYAEAASEMAYQEARERADTKARADQLMAEAEVAAAQKMMEAAEVEMLIARDGQDFAKLDIERKDSVKAGLAAAAAGLLFSLPLTLSSQSGVPGGLVSGGLSLAATTASCFLFGVTYRYVVRYDVTNSHLRGGAVGAFGLVRAGAAADIFQATSTTGPFDLDKVMGPAALFAGESMLVFTFAAAVVEKAFDLGLVKRFGQDPAAEKSS